jgi:hypothetical protein
MESKINLAQVSPVNYKVTAALVNQFVVSTTQFLNRFASRCDKKLQQVGTNMHRIEVFHSNHLLASVTSSLFLFAALLSYFMKYAHKCMRTVYLFIN